MAREHQINFRLSDDERERLARVSKHYGIGIANVLRMLLKREDDRLCADAPPTVTVGPPIPLRSVASGRRR